MTTILTSNPDMQPMSAANDVLTLPLAPPIRPHALDRQPDQVTTVLWSLVGDVTPPTIVFLMVGA